MLPFPGLAAAAVISLAPGCHHAMMQSGSTAPPFSVVACDLRHIHDHELIIINDGADNDFDAGDVLLGFQVPA